MTKIYAPKYSNSHALIIGINAYKDAPLEFAKNDAVEVCRIIKEKFLFPENNIHLLLDEQATKENILSRYLQFADDAESADDRILIFFAGHGYTRMGNSNEVGYLVPVDGNVSRISSLIRWEELTRNTDLISAKHILFIMDACYGGTAIKRNVRQGSARFAKDMMQRVARQVITAGKADQPVSDGGGPRVGHSIFTGHLLNALEGAAAMEGGVISAMGVMGYVYNQVSNDINSEQTPHYGYINGDGDFIFQLPALQALTSERQVDADILVTYPSNPFLEDKVTQKTVSQITKENLSDSRFRIALDDFASELARNGISHFNITNFPIQATISNDFIINRLKAYEEKVDALLHFSILMGKWADDQQISSLNKVISRLPDSMQTEAGLVSLLSMRWYPITLVLYASGMASLSGNNYKNFYSILMTRIDKAEGMIAGAPVIILIVENMLELVRTNVFKIIPGYERRYTPANDYIFKVLQPYFEEELFIGGSYEPLFDRFEMFLALVYIDLTKEQKGYIWGPPGRFAWKRLRTAGAPLQQLIAEASLAGDSWPPLSAGFFGGSIDRFKAIADQYHKLVEESGWI